MANTYTPGPSIDSPDPCEIFDALSRAKRRLVSGSQEQEVEYRANDGVMRRIHYASADMKRLEDEIRYWEQKCSESQGIPYVRRRFAIQGGSRGY